MSEIVLTNIIKQFGQVKAVDNFNAVIKDGEFVSILGPSGCGKTTTLRMVAGFEKATGGEIRIGNTIVSSSKSKTFVPPEKRDIGMVFQSYAVWPHMTVFDNVAYPLKIKKLDKNAIKEKTMKALEAVHLDAYEKRYPNQLSGGQQQRVALARALVAEPSLLLLDEPLSNLDAKLRESMRFEIKDLQKKLKITVIYVTHDQAEAMAMSDRIVVMNKGVIQQVDTAMNIYENPVNQFVADFIGLVNFIKADVEKDKVIIPELDYSFEMKNDFTGKGIVAVRPENISISRNGPGIKGILLRKFYLGNSADCRINVNGQTIRVTDESNVYADYKDGEEIYLQFNKLIVFPGSEEIQVNEKAI
ncbi:ABC transporter ATP-binding protein [Clostridium ganghwense]|uniref:ABC transporter ATP-binding protein n=1 Tax=Clostridium ganghwense TaxID=312089 RepID=A0ABT4CJ98_9CLOT|nr:ABC transporter ATP-binding protein [Clostridium ganghwense]MCY6369130.1 ABC transporter ATP-binding protein [Clostridium ganghwense]